MEYPSPAMNGRQSQRVYIDDRVGRIEETLVASVPWFVPA